MTKVLLVEDDPAIAEPLARALTREGYHVLAHTTGRGALSQVAESDMVILDLGLPDMDGLDVARTARAQGITIPILILTARTGEVDMVVGLDSGADDYVTKPFNPLEIIARVKSILRRRGNHRRRGPLGPGCAHRRRRASRLPGRPRTAADG